VVCVGEGRPPSAYPGFPPWADGPDKTNPPCRKSLSCPRVVTRTPENRKARRNPRPRSSRTRIAVAERDEIRAEDHRRHIG
jgi:hypothetical protein